MKTLFAICLCLISTLAVGATTSGSIVAAAVDWNFTTDMNDLRVNYFMIRDTVDSTQMHIVGQLNNLSEVQSHTPTVTLIQAELGTITVTWSDGYSETNTYPIATVYDSTATSGDSANGVIEVTTYTDSAVHGVITRIDAITGVITPPQKQAAMYITLDTSGTTTGTTTGGTTTGTTTAARTASAQETSISACGLGGHTAAIILIGVALCLRSRRDR